MSRAAFIFFLAIVRTSSLFAQGSAPGTPPPVMWTGPDGTIGTPVAPPGTSTSGSATTTNPLITNSTQGSPISLFISGTVAMADGSPVPLGLSVRRTCAMTDRTAAYTDSKGRFSFQWDDSLGVTPDSDERGFRGSAAQSGAGQGGGGMVNCSVTVDAPGFRADVVPLDDHRALVRPDIGTIYLHRLGNVEGTSVSATSFNAPPEAKKAYEKGLRSLLRGKTADAEKSFQKAVDIYPKYANAWLELGRSRLKARQNGPAREAFLKALEADGKLVGAETQLGVMAVNDGNWKDAVRYLDAALRMDPVDYPRLWYIDAVANYNTQNFGNAERYVREALKVDTQPRNPKENQLLAMILLRKRDFADAAEELRTYIRLAPAAADIDQVKQQLAETEHVPQASASPPLAQQ
jgi:tetratricopeptide (TPR) repeat protein